MEVKITKTNAVVAFISLSVGALGGWFAQKYYALKHTPEATIAKLEAVTVESKAAKEAAEKAESRNRQAYNQLVNTKQQYQDEIRPELETKIRKEFVDYIEKADETYEKAKHDREIADLKLELCKQYKRSDSSIPTLNVSFPGFELSSE